MLSQAQYLLRLMALVMVTFVACEAIPVDERIPGEDEVIESWAFELREAPDSSLDGNAFAISIQTLELEAREAAIYAEIARGNWPDFLRADPVAIQFSETIEDSSYEVVFYVMPEYLSIGRDSAYFRMQMTPI
ncbi:MAG: hypothetical protein L3J79_06880, partial [Candidatus Marinimicrobia bacterium]|nr:hypothetical protein [Candidatus Neomarinimicrobiota bacterium]